MAKIDVQPAYSVHRIGQLPAGVDAGKWISDVFAREGSYTRVLLAQSCGYDLASKIWMRADHQELATDGYPTEKDKMARLYTRGQRESGAIDAINRVNAAIRCLRIVGLRDQMGWLKDGAALIVIGGWDAKDPVLERCFLEDPRGWSGCHLVDGSNGGRIVNNHIGPCGNPAPDGPWADGLSIACRNGLIASNTILDATDGAIVVFCAPDTTFVGNTIIARTRNLMGGINLVDPFPFDANFTGTRVINNQIISDGAFIHMAIGIGSTTWGDNHDIQNYGGAVLDNLIGPGRFGYGIAAAGCKDFTVLGNRISDGTHFVGSMDMIPEVTPPTPFLRINDGWAEGTFQSDFIEGPVRYLIGVRDGLGHGMQYRSDSLQWSAGSEAALEKVRVELIEEGELVVWDQQPPGRVLWSSSSGHVRRRGNVSPMLQLDRLSGQLSIKRAQTGQVLWDPMDYLAKIGYRAFYKDPVLVLADQPPYLQVKDGGSTLFASSSAWKHFALNSGSFVAVVADDGSATALDASAPAVPHDSRPTSMTEALSHLHLQSRAPPPLPRRGGLSGQRPASNTYLWLDPHTSRLVLHTSDHPEQPQDGQIAWVSPNWKQCASQPTEPSKAILQNDGNFVIYGSGNGAVWASGTNGQGVNIDQVAIVPSTEHSPASFQLRGEERTKWSSDGPRRG